MKKTNVASEVEALLRPVVEGLGYGLWDVVYRKVGIGKGLSLYSL